MGRRAHAQRLNIWLNGTPVGYWDATAGENTLTYFDEWLGDEQGRPLSLSLPFQLHFPRQTGHPVHGKLDTWSTANWTRIPRQTGHPGQCKLDTDSAPNWTV